MTRRRKTARPRVLTGIAAVLLASGVLRLAMHADIALAIGTDPEAAAPAATVSLPETGTAALLDAFRAREDRLTAREAQLADREQAVAVAAAELEEQMTALAAAEDSLTALIAQADSAAADDLARLTAVYENMKPQDAAALFETMDPAFSAGFLAMMQPTAAAAIMTDLSPDTAYAVSVIVAGRNAGAPTE
jgi:flagellar motility protein MotE (MotC chaperone)